METVANLCLELIALTFEKFADVESRRYHSIYCQHLEKKMVQSLLSFC